MTGAQEFKNILPGHGILRISPGARDFKNITRGGHGILRISPGHGILRITKALVFKDITGAHGHVILRI